MQFNLMPWRKREQQKQRMAMHVILFLALMLALLLAGFLHVYLSKKVQRLKVDINLASATILHQRPKISMKQQSFSLFELLQALQQVGSYGVCASSLEIQNKNLLIKGYANQIVGLLAFVRYLQPSSHLPSLRIDQMQKNHQNNLITFKLSASF